MILLDTAGTVLPPDLGFLRPGWWVLHALAVALVFTYGFRRGRSTERREQRERERRTRAERPPREAQPPGV